MGWGLRNLWRHPLRTALSLAGIAVAAAMLLDMGMLSGGIEQSFAEMLLSRGYQIRITPRGTLPFDAEATIPLAGRLRAALRADARVEAAGAILGAKVIITGRMPASWHVRTAALASSRGGSIIPTNPAKTSPSSRISAPASSAPR